MIHSRNNILATGELSPSKSSRKSRAKKEYSDFVTEGSKPKKRLNVEKETEKHISKIAKTVEMERNANILKESSRKIQEEHQVSIRFDFYLIYMKF